MCAPVVVCVECVVECVLLWCGVWSGTGGVCSPVVVSVECVCVECVWWSVSGGVCGVFSAGVVFELLLNYCIISLSRSLSLAFWVGGVECSCRCLCTRVGV